MNRVTAIAAKFKTDSDRNIERYAGRFLLLSLLISPLSNYTKIHRKWKRNSLFPIFQKG